MLRPELPKANEPVGTRGKSATLNHWAGLGLGTVPMPIRLGRLASPRFRLALVTTGVNGLPVFRRLVPANCQPWRKTLRDGDSQEKFMVNRWPWSQSERPRSQVR